MGYRLIFTSAPRGLTGGRSGFCTVARSKNMSEKLAAMVEKCGVYDHSKNFGHHVFFHKKLFFAGHNYHVLTRIAETAPDYTNRSNYLAEHIVLSDTEIAHLPTPAEVILNKKDWLEKWEGEPAWLDDIEIEKFKPAYLPPAKNWQTLFADAGKAALLAQNATIFANPKDAETLLKLFAESASLHHPKIRAWDFTFTTSFDIGENSSDYNWKVFSNPSEDKMSASADAINLIRKTSPSVQETPLAKFARTGEISNRDRLGLKVGTPSYIKPRIHIKKENNKKFPYTPVIIAAVSIAALAALVCLYDPSPSHNGGTLPNTPPSPRAAAIPEQSGALQTLSTIMSNVKSEMENNEWQNAVNIWDNSNGKQLDPKGRTKILSDIGLRADKLMDEAEILSRSPARTKETTVKAEENLQAAKNAINIDAMPQKEERLKRWQELEKTIKRL